MQNTIIFRAGGLYGGWTFGTHNGLSKTTLWFNNKGWHVLPSYVNLLSNVALKLNSSNSTVKGITNDSSISIEPVPILRIFDALIGEAAVALTTPSHECAILDTVSNN